MDRYLHTIEVPHVRVELDPVTQTARYIGPDGLPITEAKHRATGTGTETPTQTSGGDGQNPGADQDHSQDSDSD